MRINYCYYGGAYDNLRRDVVTNSFFNWWWSANDSGFSFRIKYD